MIHFQGIRFTYEDADFAALDGVDFHVSPGSLICVAGPESSGKSTLFRLLNGTAPKMFPGEISGILSVGGFDPSSFGHSALGAIVTSVFDDPDSQIVSLTVEEEVSFALVQRGLPFDEIRHRARDALKNVGLSGYEHRQTGSLSGGQKQRLVMAAALALQPRLLLIDEGTSALDPEGARHFFTIIKEMIGRDGTTVVMIERNLELVLEYSDEILILDRGRVLVQGSSAVVCQEADRLFQLGLRLPAWLELCRELKNRSIIAGELPSGEKEAISLLTRLLSVRESA